jgi:hypothetical protein
MKKENKKNGLGASLFSSNERGGFENAFEKEYILRGEFYRKMESIELTVKRLRKKYSQYEHVSRFIDYLGSTERFFLEVESKRKSLEELKKTLLEHDMYRLANEWNVEEGFLNDIYDRFEASMESVEKIFSVAEELLREYNDCEECKKFIQYLRDIYVLFCEEGEGEIKLPELKEKVIRAKMESLSADGSPELSTLNEIHMDFREGV